MSEMFCFQCEQTAKGTGCTVAGVCGKNAATARTMDELTCELIALARATRDGLRTEKSDKLIMEGLFITLTNVDFDIDRIEKMKAEVEAEKNKINASEPVMDASEPELCGQGIHDIRRWLPRNQAYS
jgi:hydroxylamine reductase